MKTLYESILDNDFEVDDKSTAAVAIESLLYPSSTSYTKELKVHFENDKFVIDFKGSLVCGSDETEELLKILDACNVKKLVFNSSHDLPVCLFFRHNTEVNGYDISAANLTIVILNARVTFKSCMFRVAEDLELRGHSLYPNEQIIFGEKNTVHALDCIIDSLNVSIKKTAQFNIEYELYINNPTKSQKQWMKKCNIPMSYNDIKNSIAPPDMWTEPLSGLLKTEEPITDCVVIKGDNLDFNYVFFSTSPAHVDKELTSFNLASGWTLNINRK